MTIRPLVLSALFIASAFAAAETLIDPDFARAHFRAPEHSPGEALLLSDGKYFLFRNPETLGDRRAAPLTRYLGNGALDSSFQFTRDYQAVGAVEPLPNGQFVIAATQYVYSEKFGAGANPAHQR